MREVLQWLSDQTGDVLRIILPKTPGEERDVQACAQGQHHRASLTGRDKNRKDLVALQRARNRASFSLQGIWYSFLFSLSSSCAPRGTTPSAIICFASFREGPFWLGSVPGWSCCDTFSKICSGARDGAQDTWFGDLQLLRFTAWIILLKSTRRSLWVSVFHKRQGTN